MKLPQIRALKARGRSTSKDSAQHKNGGGGGAEQGPTAPQTVVGGDLVPDSAVTATAPGLGLGQRPVMAHVRGLTKTYGAGQSAVRALQDVNVDLYAEEFTAIMGPSGSGKSTFMHCVAGLDAITSGQIVVDGQDVGSMSERALTRFRRHRVGFIFQSFNLLPTLTAEDNIRLPLQLARSHCDRQWFDEVIAAVGLESRLRHYPSELSGGQQQRVACARALVGQPALIFADEPTGNLDSGAAEDVLQLLRSAVDDYGQTLVMVTHEPSAAAYADRVLFVADGQFVSELRSPTPERVLAYMGRIRSMRTKATAEPSVGEATVVAGVGEHRESDPTTGRLGAQSAGPAAVAARSLAGMAGDEPAPARTGGRLTLREALARRQAQ